MEKYIALGIYFIVLAIITYFSSGRKSTDDFLVASRSVGWQRLGIAIFASLFSSYNLVLGITFSYLFGPWVIVVYLGVLLAFIGIYYLVKKQNRESCQSATSSNSSRHPPQVDKQSKKPVKPRSP